VTDSDLMKVSPELTAVAGLLSTVGLTAKAVETQQGVVDLLRAFTPAEADRLEYLITFAEAEHNLIVRLVGDDRRDEAAAWSAGAIAAYRRYAAAPGAEVQRLNRDITDLQKRLAALGLTAEPVSALQLLVDALRASTPAEPDRLEYQITFAEARHNLIARLIDDHRSTEAADLVAQTVSAYRDYAAQAGADHLRVAQDLRELAQVLSDAGLDDESRTAQRAADEIPA
jgi:hypothetical protein